MALAIRVQFNELTPEQDRVWRDFFKNPGEPVFIRLPGTSNSGPCATCAQYFGMEHDGSGSEVPIIPLHDNCVCVDMLKGMAELTGQDLPEPKEKGEWIQDQPKADQDKILGKTKSAFVNLGLVAMDAVYANAMTPLSAPKSVAALARGLGRKPKAQLVKAAKKAGVDGADSMSRAELINNIAGREVI